MADDTVHEPHQPTEPTAGPTTGDQTSEEPAEGRADSRPASPTRVVLVRHAVTGDTGSVLTGRAPGVDLSEEGRAQAKTVAERLAGLPVAAVYSSPIERTVQTAEAVAAPHGLTVEPLPGVVEVEYGEWTGQQLAELAKSDLWRVVQGAPSRMEFPGGETIRAMQARAVESVDGLVTRHGGELVVVVSHSDVIKAVVAHYAGLHLDLFQRLVVSPASVTALAFHGPFPVVMGVNDTGSLDHLVVETAADGGTAPDSRATGEEES